MLNRKNPLMALVASRALARAEKLDDQQTSRAMIASLMLGNPLLSMLLVRSMKAGKTTDVKDTADTKVSAE